jgi:hypothetical protein
MPNGKPRDSQKQRFWRFPQAGSASWQIRAADLHMLLDGVDFERVKRRTRYRRPVPA